MTFRRIVVFAAIILIAVSWLSQTSKTTPTNNGFLNSRVIHVDDYLAEKKLKEKSFKAKQFVERNGFNKEDCFLIDMSLPSGQNRFFIYDLNKDSIISQGLVAHGNCFEGWLDGRRYSNVVGSGCTSLGKYKIGNPYTGKFGYSYKLIGLDSTNNNAFERTVVLHSHTCIPENETMDEICQSNGCPMVSPGFLQKLKKIINNSSRPILLWIYN
jgi:hypothetical protein